ncbi:discoidin domain-containing protein [Lysobacter sp. KIS68-7]|uniref:discoidin domain-containing protein n=1 Tax=Lysobacter sp. KIS68-7 TaxID=2904252 RepID=UPI001E325031|nr:discoidin domain-containing protein [Lysobacter sp. KIS68-7]UHQ19153.1 discoidin domain-containing protein [Lysobacter sp. KIS68-7]
MRRWIAGVLCALPLLACAQARVLDAFDSTQGWKVIASDQVTGTLRSDGQATCLDYDFHGVSGYVGLQKAIPLEYPGNYAFDFRLRGDGPKNDFQFKLVDASGDNVWWVVRSKFALPTEWAAMRFKKRHIAKAWGPSPETELRKSAKLEFTLASGEGGKGSACFDALSFEPLPPQDDSPLVGTLRGGADTWTYDLGKPRELGGAILRWKEGEGASEYAVSLSDDGKTWRRVYDVHMGDGGEDFIALPEEEARYLRVDATGASNLAPTMTLEAVEVQPLAFSATPNDLLKAIAARAPRGDFPRGFVGEQPYWTIVGIDGGREQGLLGEDGAVEFARGGFSIAPRVGGSNWADMSATQSLQDGYLPIPSVHLSKEGFKLDVTAFAEGTHEQARMIVRYRLTNIGAKAGSTFLVLEVRPWQVNPPSQFLNTAGGFSPIHSLLLEPQLLHVNGEPSVALSQAPHERLTTVYPFVSRHWAGRHPSHAREVEDASGMAMADLTFVVADLAPGASFELSLSAPLGGGVPTPISNEEAERLQAQVAAQWHDKLDRVRITVPKDGQHLVDTLRTALANMAISRVGPRLQPGTRSYSRAWIRDGAMIGEGLLRLGREDIAKDFLRWYAPYQFDSGKVPCCVDDRGADPVPENDSQGELIYLVAEVYRYTRDRALLEAMWPHVQGAVKYMDALRASERTEENRAKNPAFYGLMPASISHEGYSAKPMHSYWDDFWALRGYKDAVEIAQWLGHDDDAKRFAASRDQFRDDLYASLRTAMEQKKIDFLPGSAELGDFDATSTTIALAPGGEQQHLPKDALLATFERYWREFDQRARGQRAWKDYTPYELRTIGTLVRLGWRDRAHSALDFFFADQQPRGWNQWAEVVSHTPRKPFFVGDLPHAWVASDYVRSALDLFAYERGDAIVLAAGIPERWLEGEGVAIDGLRTTSGPLAYTLRADAKTVHLAITQGTPPPGGFIFEWGGKETRITHVPATLALPR